ncbi:hypothetical protein ACLKA7_001099 [Drosophila subpalustris]
MARIVKSFTPLAPHEAQRQSRLINRHISISSVPGQLQTAWQGGVNVARTRIVARCYCYCYCYHGVWSIGLGRAHLCASCDDSGVHISHMHRLRVVEGNRQQATGSRKDNNEDINEPGS